LLFSNPKETTNNLGILKFQNQAFQFKIDRYQKKALKNPLAFDRQQADISNSNKKVNK
jgi:hypothetical protein